MQPNARRAKYNSLECAALSALWLVAAWRDLVQLKADTAYLDVAQKRRQAAAYQSADKAAHSKELHLDQASSINLPLECRRTRKPQWSYNRFMTFIHTLAIAMGASWVSGINLYAAVTTLGLLGRFANLELPGELQVLTSWWVIGIGALLYVVEFVADKIPVVDSTWDVVHTFIRVPAGAVLAATAFGDFDKSVQVIAFLLGGGLALSSHGTKAATRAVVNTSPEPVSNIVVSSLEDVLAVVSILLSVFLPFVLFAVVASGLVLSFWLLPKVLRFFRNVFRSIRGFLIQPACNANC